ncbi:MAG TPA: glycosyltransferase [Pyrinomonadaceae bacterium]|nr:glycosyltransferase [Pyrinomonadaceae bacterium]
MNIAFFGSSLVSAYWNGAATYYRGIIRALHELGHRITFYEPDAYDRQKHRDIPDPDWARVVVYQIDSEADVLRAVEEARGVDMLVKTSGVGAHDQLLEAAILGLKDAHTLAVFWDVDAPATLDRVKADASDPFNDLIPLYDLILTYGGGEPVVKSYEALGAQLCVPIYNALDPETHHPVPAEKHFECDLALLANRLPDREARIEQFFLEAAERLPEFRFMLGGSGWADKAMPANVNYVGHVYTRDHNAFNCSARAVLNVNRDSMASYGFSPPTRIFEAAGAAACLITDAWGGIETFLTPGREVLVARDADDVVRHLEALDLKRAREIGEAARQRVLAEHTYKHRAQQLQTLLGATSVSSVSLWLRNQSVQGTTETQRTQRLHGEELTT